MASFFSMLKVLCDTLARLLCYSVANEFFLLVLLLIQETMSSCFCRYIMRTRLHKSNSHLVPKWKKNCSSSSNPSRTKHRDAAKLQLLASLTSSSAASKAPSIGMPSSSSMHRDIDRMSHFSKTTLGTTATNATAIQVNARVIQVTIAVALASHVHCVSLGIARTSASEERSATDAHLVRWRLTGLLCFSSFRRRVLSGPHYAVVRSMRQ